MWCDVAVVAANVSVAPKQGQKQHHNRKAGSKETPKLGPYWKLQPVICTVNMELRSEICL